jgi:hypothetical protein
MASASAIRLSQKNPGKTLAYFGSPSATRGQSLTPLPPVSSLRTQLERCQREVKRTISGGNLMAKIKEPLGQTKCNHHKTFFFVTDGETVADY